MRVCRSPRTRLDIQTIFCQCSAMSKADQLRALREAEADRQSSHDGGKRRHLPKAPVIQTSGGTKAGARKSAMERHRPPHTTLAVGGHGSDVQSTSGPALKAADEAKAETRSKRVPRSGPSRGITDHQSEPPTPSVVKRGRPRIEDRDKTLTAQKPWEKLGMSERTWWRRKAEAKATKEAKK